MGQSQSYNDRLYFSLLPNDLIILLFDYTNPFYYASMLFDAIKYIRDFQIIFESNSLQRAIWKRHIPPNVKMPENLPSTDYLSLVSKELDNKFNNIKKFAESGAAMKLYPLLMNKDDYNLAMKYAAQGGHWTIIQRMLELGADDIDWAMVYAARKKGNINIIENFLKLGATRYDTTLYWATRSEDATVVRRMLELGARQYM